MKNRIFMTAAAIVLILAGLLSADDCDHRGLFTEIGAGFGMVHYNRMANYYPYSPLPIIDFMQVSAATKFSVGYFVNKHILFSGFNNLTVYKYEDLMGSDYVMFNGLLGLSVSVYFGSETPGGFVTVGYGRGYWSAFFQSGPYDRGDFGLMLELGYDLSRHHRVSLQYLDFPNSLRDRNGRLGAHSRNLNFIVSWINFD